jgi:hypothetical protein
MLAPAASLLARPIYVFERFEIESRVTPRRQRVEQGSSGVEAVARNRGSLREAKTKARTRPMSGKQL